MSIVTREGWGATARGATPTSHPIGAVRGVTLHWEGPHMGAFPHTACAEKVRGIQRFHKEDRGWADVAYTALVCPHGDVYEGRGPGVQTAANGTPAGNEGWYAVCYLGGEGDGLTEDGKRGLVDAVVWLRSHGAGPRVNGHRDHKATACPGDTIYRWLQTADFTAAPNEEEFDMDENTLRAIVREEARAAVNEVLDVDMNKHDPKGSEEFRGVSLRQAIKRIHSAVVKRS